MIAVKEPEFDTQLLAGIRVALRKARDLGYPVERMDMTTSASAQGFTFHFAPLAAPGSIMTGGDLSLTFDPRTEQITEIRRGQ